MYLLGKLIASPPGSAGLAALSSASLVFSRVLVTLYHQVHLSTWIKESGLSSPESYSAQCWAHRRHQTFVEE